MVLTSIVSRVVNTSALTTTTTITCLHQVLFRDTSPGEADSFSYTVTGLRPWTQYQFSVHAHNPAGHTRSPWVTVKTRQAPPRGLYSPKVTHLQGRPTELLVSWTPPLESNGVLVSYRIQRNNVNFSFSFDPAVLSYTDEDLLPFSTYRYWLLSLTPFHGPKSVIIQELSPV